MSLLSYHELVALWIDDVITDIDLEYINSSSIDITLGDNILYENPLQSKTLSLKNRDKLQTLHHDLRSGPFIIKPGEFILAQSKQTFNLPNDISAEYKLKSSLARIGLEHLNAGWCDAGWNNSVLTLEFTNITRYHSIELNAGDKIGQMCFFKHEEVPENRSYAGRGRYNNDCRVQGIKV